MRELPKVSALLYFSLYNIFYVICYIIYLLIIYLLMIFLFVKKKKKSPETFWRTLVKDV